jgi:diguanylate cyclase (GGDEF)-like protein
VSALNGSSTAGSVPRAISTRAAWRLAGLLFVAGAITTIPGTLLLDEPIEPWKYAVTAFAVLTGLICMLIPWQRVDERWLIVVPLLAIAEVTGAIALTHSVFTYLFFFVAIYVALVFPSPRQMVPLLVLICLALMAPLAYDDAPLREALLWPLVVAPAIVLTAVVVAQLTSGLEASRNAYRRLSSQDALTGVGNYRSMMERLRHETARHARRRREFALLTLDLDNFKEVNESQGHLVGDLLLTTVGSTLDLKVRTEDTVFRQGGDEFSVVAPETDRDQAMLLADRLERALQRISSGPVQLGATVGCAIFPHDGADPAQLLDSADASLLARKRNGNGGRRLNGDREPDGAPVT